MGHVLGRMPKEGEPNEGLTLTGKLLDLEATVKAVKPVSDALVQCGRLRQYLKARRAAEKRLGDAIVWTLRSGNAPMSSGEKNADRCATAATL